ncbi:hypothetical protein Mapa_011985 [Marchantia paleacea]|nr:hypothetical protein Mapa_011985 [Marchantia paleacea]
MLHLSHDIQGTDPGLSLQLLARVPDVHHQYLRFNLPRSIEFGIQQLRLGALVQRFPEFR